MKLQMMQRYLRTFSGLSKNELNDYFGEIVEKMKTNFNHKVLAKLYEHVKNDIHIMIVLGAFTPLLKVLVQDFSVDKIIGSDITIKNGKLDIHTNIDQVQAERKTELIQNALNEKEIDWENSYAYGDSFSDLPVLELVGNPVAVCPDKKLREIAVKKK